MTIPTRAQYEVLKAASRLSSGCYAATWALRKTQQSHHPAMACIRRGWLSKILHYNIVSGLTPSGYAAIRRYEAKQKAEATQ